MAPSSRRGAPCNDARLPAASRGLGGAPPTAPSEQQTPWRVGVSLHNNTCRTLPHSIAEVNVQVRTPVRRVLGEGRDFRTIGIIITRKKHNSIEATATTTTTTTRFSHNVGLQSVTCLNATATYRIHFCTYLIAIRNACGFTCSYIMNKSPLEKAHQVNTTNGARSLWRVDNWVRLQRWVI